MRQALRQNRARARVANAASIPAPIGGWDTDSALPAMPKQNALVLDNWIPRGGYIQLRRGFVEQVSGTADPVETLVAWRGAASGDKLFACAGSKIYDVTTAGALGSAGYSSAGSARWNYTNFANDSGRFAILVNGASSPLKYNGTAFSTTSITGTSGAITLTSTNLKYVMAHKARLHFAEKDALRVWFLDVNAIAGAAGLLDLGPIFTKGGHLVGLCRLTLDGGVGPDDFACYLTSEGQVALYQGIDPSDANNWSLVGVYSLPKPIGDRCLLEYGADVLLLTEAGVLSLTQALKLSEDEQRQNSLSRYVTNAFAAAASSYGSNDGWQMISYSGRGGLLVVNVPTAELSSSQQYVRCGETGRWCRFTGIDAFCWETANGAIYFGSTLGVYQWDKGASDNSEPIVADALPAFQDFGNRTTLKNAKNVRALLFAPAIVRPALDVMSDYDKSTVPTDIQTVVTPGDISPDDATVIRQDWTGASGIGYVLSPRLRVSLTGSNDVDRVAVTDDLSELLLVGPAGTDHILSRPNLPLDVEVQCVGFDLTYEAGALI
jgi:hypothetical protein